MEREKMEKMKPKQVIENLEQMKDHLETYNQQALVPYSQKYIQALSHAINCVGAIEQIRAERDIAIQQLNDTDLRPPLCHVFRKHWIRHFSVTA